MKAPEIAQEQTRHRENHTDAFPSSNFACNDLNSLREGAGTSGRGSVLKDAQGGRRHGEIRPPPPDTPQPRHTTTPNFAAAMMVSQSKTILLLYRGISCVHAAGKDIGGRLLLTFGRPLRPPHHTLPLALPSEAVRAQSIAQDVWL